MQGKGLIQIFTAIALIVVAYQFILWFPTNSVEKNADTYATKATAQETNLTLKEERRDSFRNAYLDSVSNRTVFTIPMLKSYTYQELKQQQIAWGLDLQGGMSVVMQVDLQELIIALANKSQDKDFREALKNAKISQQAAQVDYVTLFGQEYAKLTDKPLARLFAVNEKLKEYVTIESKNNEVLAAIRTIGQETVKSTYNLLKQRIDRFGVAQPVVSLDESTDRITVELPGVRNPERARKYLQTTANLEFWELYENVDVLNELNELNENLKAQQNLEKENSKTEETPDVTIETPDTNALALADTSQLGDLGDLGKGTLSSDSTDFGPLFSILQPNFPQTNSDRSATIGYAEIANVSAVDKILNSAEAQKVLGGKARSVRFVWNAKQFDGTDGKTYLELFALNTKGRAESKLNGERVIQAFAMPNQSGSGFAVSLRMDQEGSRIWKKMTTDNVGRQVAVVLDNRVYSAPNVNEPIPNGNTSISGGFSDVTSATDLSNILSIGKLPSKTEIIEEAIVGPSLGSATVSAGLWSLFAGFILVLLFMLGYYATAGLISVLTLFLNVFFIFGSLASFGTVLTLPGIAGIVLTIGMAVDANVIIFERIREELRSGLEWKDAVLKGFGHSYSSILDANITTLIVASILYNFGLGPIKGFATVLIIGIVCSVFSAVLIGRLLFNYWMEKNKEVKVGTNMTINILANPGIDFMSKRKIAYGISSFIIIGGVISMLMTGFELGVDLKGGRSYTVQFADNLNSTKLLADIQESFETVGLDGENTDKVVVREFSKATQAKITTSFMQDNMEVNSDSIVLMKIYEASKKYSGNDISYADFEAGEPVDGAAKGAFYLSASSKVGPTVADDIRNSAGWAAGLSLLCIFLYIFFRFNKWQFSAGATVGLVHDVLIILSVFSIFKGILPFSLEIDQAFIAAILTVIGYSINDTVIVFDRIREVGKNYQDDAKTKFEDIANIALNSTISRTCITSLTTMLVVLILFLFGGSGISGFAFALLLGIVVGTYSSIFISTAVVVDTIGDKNIFDEPEEEIITIGKVVTGDEMEPEA